MNFAKFLRTLYLQNTLAIFCIIALIFISTLNNVNNNNNNNNNNNINTTASDFICGVFFIFSIIKNFRHEKSRLVRKRSISGKPALREHVLHSF